MRNAKKYKEMMFNSGIALKDGGVYWLNGDAGLKASERQKFRKILGWICSLPKMIEEKFGFSINMEIGSMFSEYNGEEKFEIYGYDTDGYQDIFYFGGVVNDVDENDGYIHHWDGFKRLLKSIDVNNLDQYLYNYFGSVVSRRYNTSSQLQLE